MRRHRILSIEWLELRAATSGLPSTAGLFLLPGVIRAIEDPNERPIALPPVQVARDGSIAALPPGVIRSVAPGPC